MGSIRHVCEYSRRGNAEIAVRFPSSLRAARSDTNAYPAHWRQLRRSAVRQFRAEAHRAWAAATALCDHGAGQGDLRFGGVKLTKRDPDLQSPGVAVS